MRRDSRRFDRHAAAKFGTECGEPPRRLPASIREIGATSSEHIERRALPQLPKRRVGRRKSSCSKAFAA